MEVAVKNGVVDGFMVVWVGSTALSAAVVGRVLFVWVVVEPLFDNHPAKTGMSAARNTKTPPTIAALTGMFS